MADVGAAKKLWEAGFARAWVGAGFPHPGKKEWGFVRDNAGHATCRQRRTKGERAHFKTACILGTGTASVSSKGDLLSPPGPSRQKKVFLIHAV